MDSYVGRTIRSYLVDQTLGKGAFGQVFLVRDQNGQRDDEYNFVFISSF